MEDFEPYFCTFENCQSPFEVPNSFSGLLMHMHSHQNGVKDVRDPGYAKSGINQATVLEQDTDASDTTDQRRDTALNRNEHGRTPFLFRTCPFCNGYPDRLEMMFADRDTIEAQMALRKHVQQHMQDFALFLPPCRSESSGYSETSQDSDLPHRPSEANNVPEIFEDILGVCEDVKCTCKIVGSLSQDNAIVAEPPLDWSELFAGLLSYDRTLATEEELRADERLSTFVLRFDSSGVSLLSYRGLETLLRRCAIRHADRAIERFWPTPLLHRILTKDRIIEELQSHFYADLHLEVKRRLDLLADRIIKYHIKIFAALVMVHKAECIHAIIDQELKDIHLPLEARGAKCELFQVSRKGRSRRLSCFQDWKIHEREAFLNLQHAVDPRILQRAQDRSRDRCAPKHEDFHEKAVLPFVQDNDVRADRHEEKMRRGYGFVTVVKIHPDCHEFQDILDSVSLFIVVSFLKASIPNRL
jgi:hypothetical protein